LLVGSGWEEKPRGGFTKRGADRFGRPQGAFAKRKARPGEGAIHSHHQ
jgi:hypothetical protein